MKPPNTIAILDDEPDRLEEMLRVLPVRLTNYDIVTFKNAPDINAWFKNNLHQCALICLDHDLGPLQNRDGQKFDPGIGQDVADFLGTCKPVCDIVIHTTNLIARPGMIDALQSAGWQVSYVDPYSDVRWIGEVWIDEVVSTLQKNSR